ANSSVACLLARPLLVPFQSGSVPAGAHIDPAVAYLAGPDHSASHKWSAQDLLHLISQKEEVGRTHARDGVPASLCREPLRAASGIRARCD
ncbi:unnamed protein product, partial [Mycena citricolor]